MGPKLLKWGKGETLYTIRAFLLGGFCAMEGEDEESPTPSAIGGNRDRDIVPADESRSFARKKVWQRIVIVIAGALMNLLLGFVLLLVYNGFLQQPYDDKGTVLFPTTTIARLEEDTSAFQTGLRAGDTILSINGRRIRMDTDMAVEMQSDEDGILQMVVRRDGEKVALDNVTFELKKDEQTGRNYLVCDFVILGEVRTFGNTITQSAKQELSVATVVWRSLVDLVRGRYRFNDLSGPVGTVDIIADTVGEANSLAGWQTLIMLMVMITVNLGVFNLLPLPALDGGRLMFLLWEGVTRRRIPPKFEGIVHFVGLLLLILLMLVVSYSDITKLFA
jgi:regulator of sigma E protease